MDGLVGDMTPGLTAVIVILSVGLGILLMANPLYLPIIIDDPEVAYVHTVQSTDGSTPSFDEPIPYTELPVDAQDAFDRAQKQREYVISDPSKRIDWFVYADEPTADSGFYVVEREGETYELWTRTVESETTLTLFQRLVVQPVLFVIGFFGIIGGLLTGKPVFDRLY